MPCCEQTMCGCDNQDNDYSSSNGDDYDGDMLESSALATASMGGDSVGDDVDDALAVTDGSADDLPSDRLIDMALNALNNYGPVESVYDDNGAYGSQSPEMDTGAYGSQSPEMDPVQATTLFNMNN